MKAIKKPVEIDFIEVKQPLNLSEIRDWVNAFEDDFRDKFIVQTSLIETFLFVRTLEGHSYQVTDKDVIIRGIKGEYYPCKKDIFMETYEFINH